jgi:hypothetical protein
MPWGDATPALSVHDALALRENVVRLRFTHAVYFSGLLDVGDASDPARYAVAVVEGTFGLDGDRVRPVRVASVAQDAVDGRVIYLTLDRPMTPYPSEYVASAAGLFELDLVTAIEAPLSAQLFGVFKEVVTPDVQMPVLSRDIANPQVLMPALPNPQNASQLGVFVVDDTGDYATDEGLLSLKKRIWRRIQTRKGGFLHLGKGYGAGVLERVKKLALASQLQAMSADLEQQIAQEPEVQRAQVNARLDKAAAGLVRLDILVRTRGGKSVQFSTGLSTH